MALLHAATLSPSKLELISAWLPSRPWAPANAADVELVGAYRLDDPEGEVGIEVHLATAGGVLVQVPLTYRAAPVDGLDDHLVATLEHSALGRRWVYDGLRDPCLVRVLAATALTGCGQAVGLVTRDGRWHVVPPTVRLAGGGWPGGPTTIDGFELISDDADGAVLRNDHLELWVARRPVVGEQPAIGLTGRRDGHGEPVVLAEVRT
ncbi:MAG: hypothetical protein S0880_00955 [Actinomycetota bacterium]|nr:hypothetical protein [Actinomycetota bacterium]